MVTGMEKSTVQKRGDGVMYVDAMYLGQVNHFTTSGI